MSEEKFMREALLEAQKALVKGEVPIGAVIVREGEIIARAHNLKEELKDPTAHAEILAIQEAARKLNKWRLSDCTLYVTLEPCPMCAGALVQSRIKRVVYGAHDLKAGAAGSVVDILDEPRFNHRANVSSGVLAEECREIMQEFFRSLRKS